MNNSKQPVSNFGDLCDTLKEIYEEVVIKKNMEYTYDGPDMSNNTMMSTSPTFKDILSPEGLNWEINEKYKEPFEVVLHIALQMGIQQGIDLASDNPLSYLEVKDWKRFDKLVKMAKKMDKELKIKK